MTIVTLISHFFPATIFSDWQISLLFWSHSQLKSQACGEMLQDLCYTKWVLWSMACTSHVHSHVSTSKKLMYQQIVYLNNL